TIGDARGLLLRERAMLTRASSWQQPVGADDHAYIATFVTAAPAREDWDQLAGDLSEAVARLRGHARLAATPLSRGGLIVRILSPSAPTLSEVAESLWSVTRRRLLGLGALGLRKL